MLLERLAQLVEQTGVLDRDDGLAGEGGEQLDLLVSERPNVHATDQDHSDRISFPQQRGSECGSMAVLLGVSRSFWKIALRRLQVQDVDGGPINHGSACDPMAIYQPRVSAKVR